MDNKEYLRKILPHKQPMILIDDVVEYSLEEKWLKSCVTIRKDCLFYDSGINGIDSIIGIEYMAQTIGCYAHLESHRTEPQVGFLLGTRLYNNAIEKFELDTLDYEINHQELGGKSAGGRTAIRMILQGRCGNFFTTSYECTSPHVRCA